MFPFRSCFIRVGYHLAGLNTPTAFTCNRKAGGWKVDKRKTPRPDRFKNILKANEVLQHAISAGKPKQYRHEEVPLKIFVRDGVSGQPLSGYITKGNWYYKTKSVHHISK
jgi:hypothetical protein